MSKLVTRYLAQLRINVDPKKGTQWGSYQHELGDQGRPFFLNGHQKLGRMDLIFFGSEGYLLMWIMDPVGFYKCKIPDHMVDKALAPLNKPVNALPAIGPPTPNPSPPVRNSNTEPQAPSYPQAALHLQQQITSSTPSPAIQQFPAGAASQQYKSEETKEALSLAEGKKLANLHVKPAALQDASALTMTISAFNGMSLLELMAFHSYLQAEENKLKLRHKQDQIAAQAQLGVTSLSDNTGLAPLGTGQPGTLPAPQVPQHPAAATETRVRKDSTKRARIPSPLSEETTPRKRAASLSSKAAVARSSGTPIPFQLESAEGSSQVANPVPAYHPVPAYNAPAPAYNAPHNAPQPAYNAPPPAHNAPQPAHNALQPAYNHPQPGQYPPQPAHSLPVPNSTSGHGQPSPARPINKPKVRGSRSYNDIHGLVKNGRAPRSGNDIDPNQHPMPALPQYMSTTAAMNQVQTPRYGVPATGGAGTGQKPPVGNYTPQTAPVSHYANPIIPGHNGGYHPQPGTPLYGATPTGNGFQPIQSAPATNAPAARPTKNPVKGWKPPSKPDTPVVPAITTHMAKEDSDALNELFAKYSYDTLVAAATAVPPATPTETTAGPVLGRTATTGINTAQQNGFLSATWSGDLIGNGASTTPSQGASASASISPPEFEQPQVQVTQAAPSSTAEYTPFDNLIEQPEPEGEPLLDSYAQELAASFASTGLPGMGTDMDLLDGDWLNTDPGSFSQFVENWVPSTVPGATPQLAPPQSSAGDDEALARVLNLAPDNY